MELVVGGLRSLGGLPRETGEGAACPIGLSAVCKVEAPGVQVAHSVMSVFTTHHTCSGVSGSGAGRVVTGTLPQLRSPTP